MVGTIFFRKRLTLKNTIGQGQNYFKHELVHNRELRWLCEIGLHQKDHSQQKPKAEALKKN